MKPSSCCSMPEFAAIRDDEPSCDVDDDGCSDSSPLLCMAYYNNNNGVISIITVVVRKTCIVHYSFS